MKHLVIGYGEIGKAVYKCLDTGKDEVCKTDIERIVIKNVDVLHICFPYSADFKKWVVEYTHIHKPKLVIVYSTVPIGTCESISENIVHSPVEGKHPMLSNSIKASPRWIGSKNRVSLNKAEFIWGSIVSTVRKVSSSRYTEFLKLRSTAKYGINLAWTEYENQVAEQIGADFDMVKEFDKDYNNLYQFLGMEEYQRYILDPPAGKIGGHCIVPNAKLLNDQFPSDMLQKIIDLE